MAKKKAFNPVVTKKPVVKTGGRPKPSAPRAGYKSSGTRYGCGGKLK